jgi:DNA replication protein DnaC
METASNILHPESGHTRQCNECGELFDLPPFRLAAQFVHTCPKCSERHAEQDQRETLARAGLYREESWKRFCPAIFHDTEPSRLPSPSKLEMALRWQYGSRGLILHGVSGRGKSRIAWAVLKREFMAGKSVAVMDCAFGYDYSAKFATSAHDAARWVEYRMTVDMLLFDDVLKVKLTDSVEQALFAIVNSRTERGLPTIVTTNDTGDSLAARMSDDRGPALLRRLREFSQSISFA